MPFPNADRIIRAENPVMTPAPEFASALTLNVIPRRARALDLACGSGQHAPLAGPSADGRSRPSISRPSKFPAAKFVQGRSRTPRIPDRTLDMWDLIVCWLYWQPDLLPEIACGVREASASWRSRGETTGRFATSLVQYREAFEEWAEIASGQNEMRVFFIAMRLEEPID